MAEIQAWNPTDDSNTDLWPEGMLGGTINNSGRAMQGLLARWFRDINGSLASSGSSNAFAVTSNRTISSLVDGTRLTFVANHSITGAATLNLNTLGAKDIKRFNGSALSSGDIISGQPVDVIYSSDLDDWIMVSALAALVGSTHADFGENGSPGDPAADTARLYAKDVGGLTMLAYRDSAGAETVLGVPARAYDDYATNEGLSSSAIPVDDSIPQNTEGTEILSAAITLNRSDSRVRISVECFGACVSAGADDSEPWTIALFRSGADALKAVRVGPGVANVTSGTLTVSNGTLIYEEAPGSVGPHTYSVRVGPSSTGHTLRLNGTTSGRLYGGAAKATLVVEEVFV